MFPKGQVQLRKLWEYKLRLKLFALPFNSDTNPSAVLLAGKWSCDSSSGSPVSSQQNQRELVTSSSFLQSHNAALPLERRPTLWWPLPISASVWISGSSKQSGATAEICKSFFLLFWFCHGSVFMVRCEQLGPATSVSFFSFKAPAFWLWTSAKKQVT